MKTPLFNNCHWFCPWLLLLSSHQKPSHVPQASTHFHGFTPCWLIFFSLMVIQCLSKETPNSFDPNRIHHSTHQKISMKHHPEIGAGNLAVSKGPCSVKLQVLMCVWLEEDCFVWEGLGSQGNWDMGRVEGRAKKWCNYFTSALGFKILK